MKLRSISTFMLLLLLVAFVPKTKAQETVTASYLSDAYNTYTFTGSITSTAKDTSGAINVFSNSKYLPGDEVLKVYTSSAQANDSVYLKVYREESGISGVWTNKKLLGIDSTGAGGFADTLNNSMNYRYIVEGSSSATKANGHLTTYTATAIIKKVKFIKIE